MQRTLLAIISAFIFILPAMAQSSAAQSNAANSPVESLMQRAQAGDANAYMELGKLKLKAGSHEGIEEAYFWFHLANEAKLGGAEESLNQAAAGIDKYEIMMLKAQVGEWHRLTPAQRQKEFKLTLLPAAPTLTVQAAPDRLDDQARALVVDFMGRRFDKVDARLDSATRKQYPESTLLGVWLTLNSQFGDFQSIQKVREEKLSSGQSFVVTCQFRHLVWDITVVFNEKGEASGLLFIPVHKEKFPATGKSTT